MLGAVPFAGLVRTLEVQRTAPIADLGHAVPQDSRDGSIPPDVAALAGVDTVVAARLVRLPATHDGSRASSRCGSYTPGRRMRMMSSTSATRARTNRIHQSITDVLPRADMR